jgi:hypothetical protein
MQSHITTLIMEAESVFETSDFINLLARLSAQENFIEVYSSKSLKLNRLQPTNDVCDVSSGNTQHNHLSRCSVYMLYICK